MANSLNKQLAKRVVVIKSEVLSAQYASIEERLFYVEGGFGASPYTAGGRLTGNWVAGEFAGFADGAVRGEHVERFATRAEIEQYCPRYLSMLPDAEQTWADANGAS